MRSQPYPWEQPERDSYPDLNYLLSEGARCRYVIAAHYLRGCRRVVEIGGFKTPVTGFMTRREDHAPNVKDIAENKSTTPTRAKMSCCFKRWLSVTS